MQSLNQPLEAVCLWDPAIDLNPADEDEAERLLEYGRTRDMSKLPFKAGAKAEVYVLRPVSNDVGAWIDSAANEADKFHRAFVASVVRVKNYTDPSGGQIDEWQPDKVRLAGKSIDGIADLFSRQERERFPRATIQEIGAVAWAYSFFPKAMRVTYRLLPTSLRILDMRIASIVAQAMITEAIGQNESKQSEASAQTTQIAESDALQFVEPGSVTATA